MDGRKAKPSTPITSSACITLVDSALQKARLAHGDENSSVPSSGLTLDLSHQKIGIIPSEVIAMVNDEVESDGENDTDYSNISKFTLMGTKIDQVIPFVDDQLRGRTLTLEGVGQDEPNNVPAIPTKNLQRKYAGTIPSGPTSMLAIQAASGTPQTSERSRSNSESGAVNRAAKRMGYIGQKNVLGTVDEARTIKHHVRGISYDSSMNEAAQRASNVPSTGDSAASISSNIITTREDNQQPETYFRRIQETSKQTTGSEGGMSVSIIETARSVLYSLYKIQPAIDSYVSLVKGRNHLPTTGIDRVLPAASLNINSLVQTLEGCEGKDSAASLDILLGTSHTAILTFKHVVNQLQQVIQGVTNQIEIRYTRTILLAVFGALVELQQAWTNLRKYIPPPNTGRSGSATGIVPRAKFPLSSPSNIPNVITQSIQRTAQEGAFIPTTPNAVLDNPLENPDEILFDKLGHTVTATLQLITLLSDAIKKTASQQNPHVQQSTLQKLRELDKICNGGSDVAKRLKNRLETIREADWLERRRFYEDITRFVTSVMSIGELLKAASSEFGFPKQVLGGFSPVARLTKEVTVLLHSSSFRALNDPGHSISASAAMTTAPPAFPNNVSIHIQPLSPAPFSAVPSTPLSAVLGPAAQATVPFLAPGTQASSTFTPSDQRSNTMQSNARTMTGMSDMGYTSSILSPRR
ncbi:hypothetical protein H072_9339 [Dactylellina haptotyla CBS 200.50]|uniref:Uncharacterized protein n=1 Tax=Dactylellina haptotyla (strain CBS 200.50) TaxID=1284197 RepID=S8A7D4_DACHA|nr:hypothetical protein H072_9339 [Dactylellina haptotyla CBS 200.50]